MRRLILLSLLVLPALALADEHCAFQAPQKLDLDLSGVKMLEIDMGSNQLHLDGAPVAGVEVRGRACASSQKLLDRVRVTQHREGDRLVLKAENDSSWNIGWSGNHYAWLDLHVRVPASLPIVLGVGSGDAEVNGVASLDSQVGSGDLDVRRVRGAFATRTGSGDIDASDIGSLRVDSVGSGDLTATGVRGDASVGNVGSGDVKLTDVRGKVDIGDIGSGDATLRRIGGSVEVGSVGSGDIDADTVGGDLTVRSAGSGDVDHRNVKGTVSVPSD